MESEAFFQEKVYLTPTDLRSEITSIDAILLTKVKQRLEQRCSTHGYVLPGTLEILTRSAGGVDSGRFSGDWSFIVKAKGRVLHPPEGTEVEVEVLKSNKMGIYAVYENAIRLMVPRDLHLGDEDFDMLKVGDRIRVEIQKSRFQLKDPFIVSVGIFRGLAGSTGGPRQPTVAPPAEVLVTEQLPTNTEAENEAASDNDDEDEDEDESEAESENEGAEGKEEGQ
jgi:hypothetical protein